MGGCQVIHMSSFWNLQRHQSAGQRLQPGISTRLTSFFGWVMMGQNVRSPNQNHGRQFLVMKHPYFGCTKNFHPSPKPSKKRHRFHRKIAQRVQQLGAPDTPPLRQGSQSPLVKMMRLLFSTADLRKTGPTWSMKRCATIRYNKAIRIYKVI